MSKKMMLLALSVACAAMFALPAVASANTWHVNATGNFTVSGGAGHLSTSQGATVTCTSMTSTANTGYTTTTTGNLRLLFHGCESSKFNCTTPGQPSGTILTEQLTFHNVMLSANTPGILVTPAANGVFADFICAGVVTFELKGNGVLGHLERKCGETSTTAGINFVSPSHGTQQFITATGVNYGLTRSGDPAGLNTTGTATFPGSRTITCT